MVGNLFHSVIAALQRSFGEVSYLYAVPVAVVLLALFYRWSARRQREQLLRFANRPVLDSLLNSFSPRRTRWRSILTIVAISLILIALARPRLGHHEVRLRVRGVDIVVLLDTSKSMLAEDVAPNRFQRAKLAITRFVDRLAGHRVALVLFAGRPNVQCPLTLDYGAFQMFLSTVNVGSVPLGGTALASAIRQACSLFSAQEQQYKALVVFSDGESHSGDVEAAARAAAKAGVVIHTVGFGTAKGAPIPIRDETGKLTGYQKSKDGNVVMTKLNAAGLSRIASLTGGRFVVITNEQGSVEPIVAAIGKMAKKELQSRTIVVYDEKYQYPLLAAILLLLVVAVLPTRANSERSRG